MSKLPGSARNLKISGFVQDNKSQKDRNLATKARGHIYTEGQGKSKIAFLPPREYKSIIPGALITANGVTRYVISKNDRDHSVVLNKSANWTNAGYGYPFEYFNPIAKMLDPANDIIGYITRSGLIHLAKAVPLNVDVMNLQSERIYVSGKNGLMILNQNDTGIYVDQDGNVHVGSVNDWTKIEDTAEWGKIDGKIKNQKDLIKLLNQKVNVPDNYKKGNLSEFGEDGYIVDSGRSLSNLHIDGGPF